MTVSFREASAWHDGATGLTADKVLSIPASQVTGDLILILASWKDFGITAQISGYTEITEFADGSTVTGNGVGSMKVGAWYKVATSDTEANPTLDFSTTTGLVGEACILVFSKSLTNWRTPQFVTVTWPSQASGNSSTSSALDTYSGGAVVGLIGIRDDSATWVWQTNAINAPSNPPTWTSNGVAAPATHASTTTGNDMAAGSVYRLVTTGSVGGDVLPHTLRFAGRGGDRCRPVGEHRRRNRRHYRHSHNRRAGHRPVRPNGYGHRPATGNAHHGEPDGNRLRAHRQYAGTGYPPDG